MQSLLIALVAALSTAAASAPWSTARGTLIATALLSAPALFTALCVRAPLEAFAHRLHTREIPARAALALLKQARIA